MGKSGFLFFGHFIAYYGLMIVIGIVIAALIAYVQVRRFHLDWNDFLIICATFGLFCMSGAKILYLIVSLPAIELERLSDFSYVSTLMSGGFVFYGGFIGIFPALYLCQKKLGISVSNYIQYCTGCFPIAHGFGRIGCYLVGCCHGIPYDGWFSVTYSDSLYAPNGVGLLPVQLLEAFGEFAIGGLLLYKCKKTKGISAIGTYMILYSVMRFLLEYLRGDFIRGSFYRFSTSQVISIVIFAIGLGMYNRNSVSEKNVEESIDK
ncbi:MAG: prolipoprotein diacylglyceryl transferase [Firmicutes bacterium]|nr:prolipoprotein diacylglyceryl transferase [Bacillota bacterium]